MENNQKTVIVNLRRETCDVRCDRFSIFGNPYRIGKDGTRDEVIEKYGPYFYSRLTNPEFRARVLALKGKRLGCWCVPEYQCHLEWIVDFLERT